MDLMQFLDMLVHVDQSLGILLRDYGAYVYAVLFAIVFCETGLVVLFFFPGDTLLFIAGAACATGVLPAAQLVCMPIFSSQGSARVTPSPLRTVRRLRTLS